MPLLAIHNGGEGLRVVERISLYRFQTFFGTVGLMVYLDSVQGVFCLHGNNPTPSLRRRLCGSSVVLLIAALPLIAVEEQDSQ